VIQTHVKESDPPHFPRWLRLGGERRGEEAASQRTNERTSIHHISTSPQRRCSCTKATKAARISGMGPGDYHDANASASVRKAAKVRRANELRSDRIYLWQTRSCPFLAPP
jgi:hypothetical protein